MPNPSPNPLNLEENNIHEAVLIQSDQEDGWLKERGNGIGGSQVSAIMHRNPWETPLSLYGKMVGVIDDEMEDSDQLMLGRRFEGPILDIFSEKTSLEITHFDYAVFHRKENPVHRFSPDALCFQRQQLIEAKYVPHNWQKEDEFSGKKFGDEGTDQAPFHILLQVLWGLYVLGKNWKEASIPAVLGGKYSIFHVERDDEMIGIIVEAVNLFWKEVERGRKEKDYVPTFPTDGRDETSRAMLQLYGDVRGQIEVIEEPSPELLEAVLGYPDISAQMKELEHQKKMYAEEIKKGIAEKPGIIVADRQFKWSRFDQTRVDSKRLKKEMPEVYEVFSRTNKSGRLTHKEV